MLQTITEEELLFCECLYDPLCLIECLFSDFDDLGKFEENEFGHVRLGQIPLISGEYLIDTERKDLSPKENFKLREGAGNIWCFAARRIGKTKFTIQLDIPIDGILMDGDQTGLTSFDHLHIRGVLEPVIRGFKNHPLLKAFLQRVNRNPNYNIQLKNGWTLNSVNQNIYSKNPGDNFFQFHFTKLWHEEAGFEMDEVFNKRQDAISELGCVERASGMCRFTQYSPPGRIYFDLTKRPWMVNLPQFINPNWDEKAKKRAIREYKGESSPNYKNYVLGELTTEGISVFDINRIRQHYDSNRLIKHFEITKKNFVNFKEILILERPPNAERMFVAADIGEDAPTEIIILSEVNSKYKYIYNITVRGLIDKEQVEIFKYLIELLRVDFIGLDAGCGVGRSILHYLEDFFPKENLFYYDGSKKIAVDFQTDEKGNVVFSGGQPVYREEYMSEWSIKRLKDLFYEGRVKFLLDYKFDEQISQVLAVQTGNRISYRCVAPEDHMYDAWRIFSLTQWNFEFKQSAPLQTKKFAKMGVW